MIGSCCGDAFSLPDDLMNMDAVAEQGPEMDADEQKDVIRLERESAIPVLKLKLIRKLADLIDEDADRVEFLTLCKRVEYTIRAWYLLEFEDLMQLYSLFDPVHGAQRLEQQDFSSEKIDVLELNFLRFFFEVMEKSQFRLVTDEDIEIAQSGQYLLNLPIEVNKSKLDNKLLSNYFKEHPHENLPSFADRYVIFRRGIGVDQTSGYFIMEKIDTIISWVWVWTQAIKLIKKLFMMKRILPVKKLRRKANEDGTETEEQDFVERKRIENMEISVRNLLGRITLQEPTFDRMIVIYRRASSKKKSDRGIYVKHFKNIPMADMELVLPEKKNPGLTPMEWIKFLVSVSLGLVTLISSFQIPKFDVWIVIAILSALSGYCAKIYFTYKQKRDTYQNLITRAMYDKQLDSGRGTLLHLCDDVIQQEVKEVIISYFILMKQGNATIQDLDRRCESLIKDEFGVKCNFDVVDAIQKLEKLEIITTGSDGRIECVDLKNANHIIGTTTEELVMKAKRGSAS